MLISAPTILVHIYILIQQKTAIKIHISVKLRSRCSDLSLYDKGLFNIQTEEEEAEDEKQNKQRKNSIKLGCNFLK